MATTPRPFPYVYVSWLTKILAGEAECVYQPWVKSHFKYQKRPDTSFNLAAWTADHSTLVASRAKALEQDGWTVTLEDANSFQLLGKTALLAGKPDILAVREGEALVVDAKTGQQRHSDFFQVLIYMLALPRVRGDCVGVRGEVTYATHRIPVSSEELTPAIEAQIFALLRTMGDSERPPTVPSERGCAWCDVADCRDRFVGERAMARASEF